MVDPETFVERTAKTVVDARIQPDEAARHFDDCAGTQADSVFQAGGMTGLSGQRSGSYRIGDLSVIDRRNLEYGKQTSDPMIAVQHSGDVECVIGRIGI